jgi:hypothetical protein
MAGAMAMAGMALNGAALKLESQEKMSIACKPADFKIQNTGRYPLDRNEVRRLSQAPEGG